METPEGNEKELPANTAPSAAYSITVDASQSCMNARTKEEYDERMQRHFDACRKAGRRWAYRREQRILNALLATAVAGCQPGDVAVGRIIYEAQLHHAEGLSDEDVAEWVGKPVMDETRTKAIGRVVKVERCGNFVKGTIEFDEGEEPKPNRTVLAAGEIVGPVMFQSAQPDPLAVELEGAPEPKQETWRDRPPML